MHVSYFLFFSKSAFSNPHFNSEIALGEANVARISPRFGFAYNPASLASHTKLEYSPFFMEHNYNKAIQNFKSFQNSRS
jgi:hypothetical protein